MSTLNTLEVSGDTAGTCQLVLVIGDIDVAPSLVCAPQRNDVLGLGSLESILLFVGQRRVLDVKDNGSVGNKATAPTVIGLVVADLDVDGLVSVIQLFSDSGDIELANLSADLITNVLNTKFAQVDVDPVFLINRNLKLHLSLSLSLEDDAYDLVNVLYIILVDEVSGLIGITTIVIGGLQNGVTLVQQVASLAIRTDGELVLFVLVNDFGLDTILVSVLVVNDLQLNVTVHVTAVTVGGDSVTDLDVQGHGVGNVVSQLGQIQLKGYCRAGGKNRRSYLRR